MQADRPAARFGSAPRWSVDGQPAGRREALLRFGVRVPTGQEVRSAMLRTYPTSKVPAGRISVHAADGDWDETTTWLTSPLPGAWIADSSVVEGWVEWDVTTAVAAAGGPVNLLLRSLVDER
ncbi:DNRLRE domain-containing protein [Blastococcus sp. SYSU DS0973]